MKREHLYSRPRFRTTVPLRILRSSGRDQGRHAAAPYLYLAPTTLVLMLERPSRVHLSAALVSRPFVQDGGYARQTPYRSAEISYRIVTIEVDPQRDARRYIPDAVSPITVRDSLAETNTRNGRESRDDEEKKTKEEPPCRETAVTNVQLMSTTNRASLIYSRAIVVDNAPRPSVVVPQIHRRDDKSRW